MRALGKWRSRLAVASMNQTPIDWEENRAHHLSAIELARQQGAKLLLCQELSICGYGCEDMLNAEHVLETSAEMLGKIAEQSKGMVVLVGLPVRYRSSVYNCVAVIVDGAVKGFVPKKRLAGDGLHYEPRWFKEGQVDRVDTVRIQGKEYPFGDLIFRIGDITVGTEICEEAWGATRQVGRLWDRGVVICCNPSASHFGNEKSIVRDNIVTEGSRMLSGYYLYANGLGNEAGRAIYDGDCRIAGMGSLLLRLPRFSFEDVRVGVVEVDLNQALGGAGRVASADHQIGEDPGLIDCGAFDWEPGQGTSITPVEPAAWETAEYLREECFSRALALALFDYLRKSKQQGFTVSLSGGADSASVAVLVALMVRLGLYELGLTRFKEKLGHITTIQPDSIQEAKDLIKNLLTCVYQRAEGSTEVSENAARTVAEALGATYTAWDIQPLVEMVEQIITASGLVDKPLTWENFDIPKQNIKARLRAAPIWYVANLKNQLLLTTSNRSEAAVGYATMDGDTAGGYNPIGGIDKAFLKLWLLWMQKVGCELGELYAVPQLILVNEQKASAELRPDAQTDEADLMPYPVMDVIEKAAIRDKLHPIAVFEELLDRSQAGRFEGVYSPEQLASWTARFFHLWSINQWKRERYAPSPFVDQHNLDPRSWLRFPILSGGFQRELSQLALFVQQGHAVRLEYYLAYAEKYQVTIAA